MFVSVMRCGSQTDVAASSDQSSDANVVSELPEATPGVAR
jgi:hypothetical protein